MEKEKPISYEQTPEQIREVLVRARLENFPDDFHLIFRWAFVILNSQLSSFTKEVVRYVVLWNCE